MIVQRVELTHAIVSIIVALTGIPDLDYSIHNHTSSFGLPACFSASFFASISFILT